MALPTDILSVSAELVPKHTGQALTSACPLEANPQGPLHGSWDGEKEFTTETSRGTLLRDPSRDSPPEQQEPPSSTTWPQQGLFINYVNNNSRADGNLSPSWGRPQAAAQDGKSTVG